MRGLIFILLLAVQASCSHTEERVPDDIISPDSMVMILADFHIAEAIAGDASLFQQKPDMKKSFYKYILTHHQINYQKLKLSLDYYSARPKQFSAIYEQVLNELSKRQAEQKSISS